MANQGFRLGQVLDHKRRIEERRQLELQGLMAAEERLQIELEELQTRIEGQMGNVVDRVRTGTIDAAELEAASRYVARLERLVEQQRELLEQSAADVALGREALVLALQERRALELLQERQDSAARLETDRREERAVDDMNAARFGTGLA